MHKHQQNYGIMNILRAGDPFLRARAASLRIHCKVIDFAQFGPKRRQDGAI